MTKLTLTNLSIVVSLGYFLALNSCASVARMQEAENKAIQKQAPAECLSAFREFFAYVKKMEPDIIRDKNAQDRWLSLSLKKALENNVARFGKETNVPDFPTNQTFLGVWNKPENYSIIGSRHYDYHDGHNPDDNRAVIDVLYDWGYENSLENQYPGEKSLLSFIFVFEEGAWRLDDIYTFNDKFAPAESLNAYWSRNK